MLKIVTLASLALLAYIGFTIWRNEVRAKISVEKRAFMRQRLFRAVADNPVRPAGVYGWTIGTRWARK